MNFKLIFLVAIYVAAFGFVFSDDYFVDTNEQTSEELTEELSEELTTDEPTTVEPTTEEPTTQEPTTSTSTKTPPTEGSTSSGPSHHPLPHHECAISAFTLCNEKCIQIGFSAGYCDNKSICHCKSFKKLWTMTLNTIRRSIINEINQIAHMLLMLN